MWSMAFIPRDRWCGYVEKQLGLYVGNAFCSLKSVWDDVLGIHQLEPDQTRTYRWSGRSQSFWRTNDITYDWLNIENKPHNLVLHIVVCTETWSKNESTACVWVSGTSLTQKNIINRCNRAARHRWGIEVFFLIEKRRWYNYEHPFSYNWNALKGWHARMRIAHLINILTLHN